MSEAELFETVANYHGLAMGAMTFYVSIVTAYLVTARFVGSELERSEIATITVLFTVFSVFATWGSVEYFRTASHFLLQTKAYQVLLPEELISPHVVVGLAEVLGIAASLGFMWAIRVRNRPRTIEDQSKTETAAQQSAAD